METNQDITVLDLMQILALKIVSTVSKKALQYGKNRGGVAIGFKDADYRIWSIVGMTNPELPSRWGGSNDQYDLYAGLKLATALRFEINTTRLPAEMAPLMAVHPGGVVRFHPGFNMWIGVAYSGHHGYEDKEIASETLDEFFPLTE